MNLPTLKNIMENSAVGFDQNQETYEGKKQWMGGFVMWILLACSIIEVLFPAF